MRRAVVTVAIAGLLVLSGCMATENIPEPKDVDKTIEFPAGAVVGEASVVTVEVENTVDTTISGQLALTVAGQEVTNKSINLDSGESTTVNFTHTFEETGEYDLSVGDEETTITVYETPFAFINATSEPETVRENEYTVFNGTVDFGTERYGYYENETKIIKKDFRSEQLYASIESNSVTDGERSTETAEEWVVGGTRYTKTVPEDGEVTYDQEPSDEFDDDSDDNKLDNREALGQYLRTNHTDEAYVILLETNSSDTATDLWAELDGDGLQPENVTDVAIELQYDRQTGQLRSDRIELSVEDYSIFAELDMTIETEYTDYGEPVDVDVPDEVKQKATGSEY